MVLLPSLLTGCMTLLASSMDADKESMRVAMVADAMILRSALTVAAQAPEPDRCHDRCEQARSRSDRIIVLQGPTGWKSWDDDCLCQSGDGNFTVFH